MTLLELRKQLVMESGHVELVADWEEDDWDDRGANSIINRAVKWLDRNFPEARPEAVLYKTLPANTNALHLEHVRYIVRVEEQLAEHIYLEHPRLMENKFKGYLARYFSVTPPEMDEVPPPTSYARILYVHPQSHVDRAFRIRCAWRSAPLVEDTDVNFWTLEDGDLVLRASRMMIEIDLHRNTTGRRDFEEPLRDDLLALHVSMVREQTEGPPYMFVMGE